MIPYHQNGRNLLIIETAPVVAYYIANRWIKVWLIIASVCREIGSLIDYHAIIARWEK